VARARAVGEPMPWGVVTDSPPTTVRGTRTTP